MFSRRLATPNTLQSCFWYRKQSVNWSFEVRNLTENQTRTKILENLMKINENQRKTWKIIKKQNFKHYLKCILTCSYNIFSSPRDSKHIVKLFLVPKTISKLILWGSRSDGKSIPNQNPWKSTGNQRKSFKNMKNQNFKNCLNCILACSYNVFSSPSDSKHIVKLFPILKTIKKLILWGS